MCYTVQHTIARNLLIFTLNPFNRYLDMMSYENSMKRALVFGGNGFLGSYVIRELCEKNFQVITVSRNEGDFALLKTCGFPGQVLWKQYDVTSETFSYDFEALDFDVAINLIGIGLEKKSNLYHRVHIDFPFKLAALCRKRNIKLIHVSAFLGSNEEAKIGSRYVRTKLEGVQGVRNNNAKAIIINPTLIVGKGDSFIQTFETIISYSPLVPLIFGGKTRLKPVYAGDVAKFIAEVIFRPEMEGKDYIVSGSEIISFRKFLEKIALRMRVKRFFISIPFFIFNMIFALKKILPGFVFRTKITKDILQLSKFESIPEKNDLTLLVQKPQTISKILNLALEKYRLYD